MTLMVFKGNKMFLKNCVPFSDILQIKLVMKWVKKNTIWNSFLYLNELFKFQDYDWMGQS